MKIHAYNSTINSQNFKASYPVVYWVAEANGSYAPLVNKKYVEAFHEKFVSTLNDGILIPKEIKELAKKRDKNATKKEIEELKKIIDIPGQILRAFIGASDKDYRNCYSKKGKVRSFYDKISSNVNDFLPVSYVLSGNSVPDFVDKYCKPIGRAYRESGGIESEKVKKAKQNYHSGGLSYVNNYKRRIVDNKGRRQVLHTKFQITRNEEGEIIGYRYIDARFLPEFGPESPFEKLKMRNCKRQ